MTSTDNNALPDYRTIALARDGRLLTITLNQPDSLNTINLAMLHHHPANNYLVVDLIKVDFCFFQAFDQEAFEEVISLLVFGFLIHRIKDRVNVFRAIGQPVFI